MNMMKTLLALLLLVITQATPIQAQKTQKKTTYQIYAESAALTPAEEWLRRGDQLYGQKNYQGAVACYGWGADGGNAEAQFKYGYALYFGEGIENNFLEAALWFKRASQQDYPKAMYNLAYCYMYGKGVPSDYEKALDLLKQSATAGCCEAQVTLAECYEKGVLVEQNDREAKRWKALAEGTIDSEGDDNQNTDTPEENPAQTDAALTALPIVKILFPQNQAAFHTDVVKIKYQLIARGKEEQTHITVLVDGVKQPIDRTVKAANTIDVDMPNHDCTVTIYAQNDNGYSEPASVRLIREKRQEELPRLFVVAIGVGEYHDVQLPSLQYTCKDATDFSKAVKSKRDKPYSDVQVKLLTDSMATREEFFESLEWMKQEASPNDVCMFFYAGHGYRDAKDRFYFMPFGATTDKLYNCFNSADFRREIEDVNSKLVVFVDACYSGALMGGERSAASNFVEQLRRTRNGMVLYASSASDTKSKEADGWKNGAFTKALIEAFNGEAKQQGDEGLSTQQLENYLYNKVRELTGYKQTPIFINPGGIEHFNLFTYE